MKSLSPQVVSAAKLPILNPNEFDLWKMRIEQYFLMTDYSLWEVILNGDSLIPTRVIDGAVQPVAPTTAEQRLARKNELKARGTLLMALSDKHQLKFNIHKDAKSLMEAIEKSLKIYEAEVKSSSSTSPTTQNITFVSSQNIDITNESVSAVTSVSAASTKVIVSALSNVDTLSDASFQEDEEPTNYALMAFTSSSSSSSGNEVASCSKACTKAYATLQSHYDKFTNDLRKSQFDVLSSKTGLESVEARLVVYQQNETIFEEDIKLLKLDVMLRGNALVDLRKKFEKAEQERDELKLKLVKFQTFLKNLSKLLASQITDKTGLGCDNQVFTSTVFDCAELISFESDVSMPTSPVCDSTTKPHKDMSHSNRPSAPIVKDWVSNSKDKSEGEPMPTQKAPSFVQTTEHIKTLRPSIKPVEHPIPAEKLRRDIPKARSHRHSKNRKTCFVCKSLTHLIKDCDYYKKKMVQKPVMNHAIRGNHQHYARMTHPHPHRHVVPTTVLTRSRLVPLNAARPVNTVVPPTKVQHQSPTKHGVNKAHSPIRRPINLRPSP
nr:hypothetical protein [Tanacetum cinerariifolium]